MHSYLKIIAFLIDLQSVIVYTSIFPPTHFGVDTCIDGNDTVTKGVFKARKIPTKWDRGKVIKQGEDPNEKFHCKISANISFECSFKFTYRKDYMSANCLQRSPNNIVISLFKADTNRAYGDTSFQCTSDLPMSVEIGFSSKIDEKYTRLGQERLIANYNDKSTYRYRLNIAFPEDKGTSVYSQHIVKFKIFNSNDPKTAVNIFLEFLRPNNLHNFCRLYSLKQNIRIHSSSQGVVNVPCINILEDDNTTLHRLRDVENLTINNSTITYRPMEGFHLKSDLLISADYYCRSYFCCEETYGKRNITIEVEEPEEMIPKTYHLYIRSPTYNILKAGMETSSNLNIMCSSVLGNVTLQLKYLWWWDRNIYPVMNETYRYYNETGVTKRFYGTVELPWHNMTALDMPLQLYYNSIRLYCSRPNTKQFNWVVHYDGVRPLYFSHKDNVFICESPNYDVKDGFSLSLKHWECKNILQCQILIENCLSDKAHEKLNPSCMGTILNRKTASCAEVGAKRYFHTEHCAAIRPSSKGVVHCSATRDTNFDVQEIYFMGFDGKIYLEHEMETEPPVSATLKLGSMNSGEYFYTNQRFVFYCEAHSFFFYNGLQWFIQYSNGSELQVYPEQQQNSADGITNIDMNPSSKISVFFDDTTIHSIICSAPVLNQNIWRNISISTKIYESIPPKILVADANVKFIDGAQDQSISCQSSGLPIPAIKWTRFNENISEPFRVFDKIILLFPIFNDSFSGDYICTASNVAGEDSKIFKITKKIDTNNYLSLIAVVLIGLGIGILLLAAFAYWRNEKLKKYRIMKEVLRLLNGRESVAAGIDGPQEESDPLKMVFDEQYDINNSSSFYVDRKCPLGKGEFGEVNKGLMEGVDGHVAFKTVPVEAPVVHLKALVSELKILMYLGPHECIVTLLGAYRQEIERGILFMAIEFCGLGSLKSYLDSNRHLFKKCQILNSCLNNDMYTNVTSENSNHINTPQSLHSITSLLKWSFQIASGMDFIGTKNVIHSDLAMRNVLLTAEANAKITDFGLSRRIYERSNYIKKGEDPLPWRWLAIESLQTKTFTTKSDVWSYGITLWEIFSLGEVPYPGFSFSIEFVSEIEKGLRNIKPKYASQELYDIMLHCWNVEPSKRPKFSSLKIIFENCASKRLFSLDIEILSDKVDIDNGAKQLAEKDYIEIE